MVSGAAALLPLLPPFLPSFCAFERGEKKQMTTGGDGEEEEEEEEEREVGEGARNHRATLPLSSRLLRFPFRVGGLPLKLY